MNSPFVRDMATRFSARLKGDTPEQMITGAYEQALGRQPGADELRRMKGFFEQQKQLIGNKSDADALALREFCLALLCLNEFIYVD